MRSFVAAALFLSCSLLFAQKSTERLKEVDGKFVCFINKKHFPSAQIPVQVEGKTYYGCCDACKSKLQEDPKSRMDIDPVSGKEVDKATAVIGVDKAGNVYFFENKANLKKYRAKTTPPPAT